MRLSRGVREDSALGLSGTGDGIEVGILGDKMTCIAEFLRDM